MYLTYVTSVRPSPDGKTLAYTIVSPDGDGDGRGLEALRVRNVAAGQTKTLARWAFRVNPDDGSPEAETGGLQVKGWLDGGQLVVRKGCCDDGQIAIVSAKTPSNMNRWPPEPLLAETGVTPFVSTPKHFPYGGKGTVVSTYL